MRELNQSDCKLPPSLRYLRFNEAIITLPAPPDDVAPIAGLRFSNFMKGLVTAIWTFISLALPDLLHGLLPRPSYCVTRTADA